MQARSLKTLQLTATNPMLGSCDGLRLHYAEKDAIIFFCAPLLRQLPLRSLLCLSLLCTDAKAAQLGSSSCASLALPPAIVRKTRGRDCGQRLSRKGARPLSSALLHGSLGDRSDDPRRTKGGQRENIDVHGRLHQPLWWAAPSEINDALLAAGAAEER